MEIPYFTHRREQKRQTMINWGARYVLAQLREQVPYVEPPYSATIDRIPRGFSAEEFVEFVGEAVRNRTDLEFDQDATTRASFRSRQEAPGFNGLHPVRPGATLVFTRSPNYS